MGLSPRTKSYEVDDASWRVSRAGKGVERTVRLDISAFTAATHYPNGFLPSGLPLARITATGAYGPYDSAAVDGRSALEGFLAEAQHEVAADEDRLGPLMWTGVIRPGLLPIPVDAAGLADVAGRIYVERG